MIDAALKKELRKKYGTEQVFVVPYSAIADLPDKFSEGYESNLSKIVEHGKFMLRSDAEYNTAVSQLIPYIFLYNKDATKFYVSRRIKGDTRLQGKWSFFGGHINPIDYVTGADVLLQGAVRELNEEVDCKTYKGASLEYIGTIRDLVSKTSEHTGFVYGLKTYFAKIKETDNLEGKWMTFNELINNYENFESWGKYVIDYLFVLRNSKAKREA